MAGFGSAAAWPLAARAQHPPLPVIGFLDVSITPAHLTAAFNRGLGEQGYVDGRNVEILLRYTETYARLPALAEELVRSPAAVIFTSGGPAPALVAKSATTTIPIVFVNGADPVELGLVGSQRTLSHRRLRKKALGQRCFLRKHERENREDAEGGRSAACGRQVGSEWNEEPRSTRGRYLILGAIWSHPMKIRPNLSVPTSAAAAATES
jgi:hypothetical protein